MKFTKEAWENAPEGARLEWAPNISKWASVDLIGFMKSGAPVIEECGELRVTHKDRLRITLPKRKVTVQLWRDCNGYEFSACTGTNYSVSHTLLGEHTFEIEGE